MPAVLVLGNKLLNISILQSRTIFLIGRYSFIIFGLLTFFVVNLLAAKEMGYSVDRNIEHYRYYLKEELKSLPKFLSHFPTDTAEECTFYRGIQIDIAVMQLRCRLSEPEINKLTTEYLKNAEYIQEGYDDKRIPFRFRNEKNTGFALLSTDFKVIVIYTESENKSKWAKYYNCGVAINAKRNEVIFWALYNPVVENLR